MDVESWLKQLGLSRYAQAFRDNDIDVETLPFLSSEDLKELGVGSVGHRRRMLQAITALRVESVHSGEHASVKAKLGDGERRQVTVMFCDLVEFTPMAARLDPEDLAKVVAEYHAAVSASVRAQGGHVAQFLGDGVMAYFGWPEAHEDDAERSIRAALSAVASAGKIGTVSGQLAARAGVATGLIVGGELLGDGPSRGALVGETPNLAARLQAEAQPGTVVVCPTTHRLADSLFVWEELGARSLKGFSAPVPLFRALAESGVESRSAAQLQGPARKLIGRHEELAILHRRWAAAASGDGQVVLIGGEAGIGKSSLVGTFLAEAKELGAPQAIRWFCSPQHSETALYPVSTRLLRAAGLTQSGAAQDSLERLISSLGDAAPSQEGVALVASLLGIDTLGKYPKPSGTPQKQRENLLAALLSYIERLTVRAPLLALLEDAHWADASTREFIDLLAARTSALRLLLIVTHRPGHSVPWAAQPQVTSVLLRRFDRRRNAELIASVANGKPLPADVAAQIEARSDGIPLFTEELTRAVVEGGALREEEDCWVPVPGTIVAASVVPPSLQASLLARLDRIAPARELVQTGAILGREFSYALLCAVTRLPEQRIRDGLAELSAADMLHIRGPIPHAVCVFRHALIQEAAAASMLRSRRAELHLRAAQVIETEFPEIAEAQPELLGRHYAEADRPADGARGWVKAGRQALSRSAQIEAEACLTEALRLIAQLDSGTERNRQELEVLQLLAGPRHAVHGAAGQNEELLRRTHALATSLDDPDALARSCLALSSFLVVAGRYRETVAIGESLAARVSDGASPATRAVVCRIVGWGSVFVGELERAQENLSYCVEQFRTGVDWSARVPGSHAHAVATGAAAQAFVEWGLGRPETALRLADEVASALERTKEPATNTLGFAYSTGMMVSLLCRMPGAAEEYIARLHSMAERDSAPWWQTNAEWCAAAVTIEVGDLERGLHQLQAAALHKRRMGGLQWEIWIRSIELHTKLQLGHTEGAVEDLERLLEQLNTMQAWFFETEVYLVAALLADMQGREQVSESWFIRAMKAAEQRKALSWKLRSAISFAKYLNKHNRETEARTVLNPVFRSFKEGSNLPDLKEAAALHLQPSQ